MIKHHLTEDFMGESCKHNSTSAWAMQSRPSDSPVAVPATVPAARPVIAIVLWDLLPQALSHLETGTKIRRLYVCPASLGGTAATLVLQIQRPWPVSQNVGAEDAGCLTFEVTGFKMQGQLISSEISKSPC